MNTLGANLASVRSAHEAPSGRTARDDENPGAFGALLGSLSEEQPATGAAAPRDPAQEAEDRDSESPARPSGDAASALTILAAIAASAAMTNVPAGAGPRGDADPIQALLARALPSAAASAGAASLDQAPQLSLGPIGSALPGPGTDASTPASLGRLRVTVLAQETHFAPVLPHAVSLMAVPSAAAAAPPDRGPAFAGMVQGVLAEGVTGIGQGQATSLAPPAVAASGFANPVAATGAAVIARDEALLPGAHGAIPDAAIKPVEAELPAAEQAQADDPAAHAQSPAPPASSMPLGPTTALATQSAVSVPAPRPAHAPATSDRIDDAAEGESLSGESIPSATLVRREAAQAADGIGESRTATGAVQEPHAEIGQSVPSATIGMPSASATEPSRQVAEAVMAQMGRMPAAAQPGLEGPLRILTIQLRPDDLGTVVVRMRLRGDQLEMSLHASREETAALLRSDAAALDGLLRSAGYQPDLVTIGSGRVDSPTSGETARAGAGSGFEGQNGQSSDPGGAMEDGSGQRRRDGTRHDTQREPDSNETNPGGPGRIGRYL